MESKQKIARTGKKKSVRKRTEHLVGKTLKFLLISGGVAIALTSPYFASKLVGNMIDNLFSEDPRSAAEKEKKMRDAFYYLRNKGLIEMRNEAGGLRIRLTEEGRKVAGKYQINDLKIKKDKRWDKKWRILIFDIDDRHKIKRDALRLKLKELGFYQLQKSVWVYPYNFDREAVLLREFFGLDVREMTIINEAIVEGDDVLKEFFEIA